MDYSKGKIYKIVDLTNDDIYIGSTAMSLDGRWGSHQMFNLYDKNKEYCEMILIEDYPCESRRQLEEREQYYMDNTECINKRRAFIPEQDIRIRGSEAVKKFYHTNSNKIKQRANRIRDYQRSWGGLLQENNLCMLRIDPDLFLVNTSHDILGEV